MNWFLMALKKYADFKGRSQRSEYWFFFLFYVLIMVALSIVGAVLGESGSMISGILIGIFVLGTIVPMIAVTVRRLHDTDRSGWFFLVTFIPAVGSFILLYFCVLDSQAGTNRFGPNPKGL